MTTVLEADGLGKRYRGRWALRDCTLAIPEGHVVGLVGPNGAGKSTLFSSRLALVPVHGEHRSSRQTTRRRRRPAQPRRLRRPRHPAVCGTVCGRPPPPGTEARLALGRRFAMRRISEVRLDPHERAGTMSGGQRAQLALTLALAKRPELLLLDEPVASLDPLARRDFLRGLMEVVAEHETAVVLSSHLVADLERVCDYVIILAAARVQLAGEVEDLLATHHRLIGPRRDVRTLPSNQGVIEESHTTVRAPCSFGRTIRSSILHGPWTASPSTTSCSPTWVALSGRARSDLGVGGRPMIWLTWRQFRLPAIVALGALAVVAIIARSHWTSHREPLPHQRYDVHGQLLVREEHIRSL